jgi:hypothetical protein
MLEIIFRKLQLSFSSTVVLPNVSPSITSYQYWALLQVIWLLYGIIRQCSKADYALCCADRLILLASASSAFTTPATVSPQAPSLHAPRAPTSSTNMPPSAPMNLEQENSVPNCVTLGNASSTTAQQSSLETLYELSEFTCTVMSLLDDRFTNALLLLCSSVDVPCWIRSGCLISACMSICDTLPSDSLVTAAQMAAEHVLYACMSTPCQGAAACTLKRLLTKTCRQPMLLGQAEMLAAVVQHIAVETHAFRRQQQCMSMRVLLSSDPNETELFSIPLKYSNRLLLMAKVKVPSLGRNIKSSILHGWSLNIKTVESDDEKVNFRPGTWLPVSLFLQNHLSVPRKVSFLVGLTPAHVDGARGLEEDHATIMASLHDICSSERDLAQVRHRFPLMSSTLFSNISALGSHFLFRTNLNSFQQRQVGVR